MTASFSEASLSLSGEGRSCSFVMFTLTSVLSIINHTGPQGPHNSNVTPCQSVTVLILIEREKSAGWREEMNLFSISHS